MGFAILIRHNEKAELDGQEETNKGKLDNT